MDGSFPVLIVSCFIAGRHPLKVAKGYRIGRPMRYGSSPGMPATWIAPISHA